MSVSCLSLCAMLLSQLIGRVNDLACCSHLGHALVIAQVVQATTGRCMSAYRADDLMLVHGADEQSGLFQAQIL